MFCVGFHVILHHACTSYPVTVVHQLILFSGPILAQAFTACLQLPCSLFNLLLLVCSYCDASRAGGASGLGGGLECQRLVRLVISICRGIL